MKLKSPVDTLSVFCFNMFWNYPPTQDARHHHVGNPSKPFIANITGCGGRFQDISKYLKILLFWFVHQSLWMHAPLHSFFSLPVCFLFHQDSLFLNDCEGIWSICYRIKAWTYCWWLKSCTSWYGKVPIIYRVLYIPGGAGFLPSIVLPNFRYVMHGKTDALNGPGFYHFAQILQSAQFFILSGIPLKTADNSHKLELWRTGNTNLDLKDVPCHTFWMYDVIWKTGIIEIFKTPRTNTRDTFSSKLLTPFENTNNHLDLHKIHAKNQNTIFSQIRGARLVIHLCKSRQKTSPQKHPKSPPPSLSVSANSSSKKLIPFKIPPSWWIQPNWKILVKLDHFPK